jgi:hypothetical protein
MTPIKWIAAWIVGLGLLAACGELSSKDDPREDSGSGSGTGSGSDSGTCSGLSVLCNYRANATCNSGCVLQDTCSLTVRAKCVAITSPDLCDADAQCRYSSSSFCQPKDADLCSLSSSKTACDRDATRCVWGPTCTGFPDGCYKSTSASSCTANLGCTWTPK